MARVNTEEHKETTLGNRVIRPNRRSIHDEIAIGIFLEYMKNVIRKGMPINADERKIYIENAFRAASDFVSYRVIALDNYEIERENELHEYEPNENPEDEAEINRDFDRFYK